MPVNCGIDVGDLVDKQKLNSETNIDMSKNKGRIKPLQTVNGLECDNDVVLLEEKSSAHKDVKRADSMDLSSDQEIFGWVVLDGIRVPFLFRDTVRFCAVRMVEMKLLSKYPSTYPEELKHRAPLMSHYITQTESDLLNKINKEFCKNEYGEHLFTTQDLIVKLSDFREFLTIVKKHFPENILESLAKVTPPISLSCDGGWLQINNTIMPYVIRSKIQKFVPLSVVRYAAGLLTDVLVDGDAPTEGECDFLNKSCDDTGLTFRFTKASRLVQLELVFKLASSLILFIKDLPRINPLDEAVYCVSNEEQSRATKVQSELPNVVNGISPKSQPIQVRPPPPPYQNNLIMIKPLDQQTEPQMFQQNAVPLVMMEDQFIKHPMIGRGPPNVTVKKSPNNDKTFLGKQQTSPLPIPSPNFQMQRQFIVCNEDKDSSNLDALKKISEMRSPGTKKISSGPIHAALLPADAASLGQWQKVPEDSSSFQMVPTQPVVPQGPQMNMPSPQARLNMTTRPADNQIRPMYGLQIVLPEPIKIQAIPFHGRAVSCLIKEKKAYALLEALCSLYFKHISVQQFHQVLELQVGIPTVQLQEEEEKAFIDFYNLPTTVLKCNKVVDLYELGPKFQLLTDLIDRIASRRNDRGSDDTHSSNEIIVEALVAAQYKTREILKKHFKKRKRNSKESPQSANKIAKKGLEAAVARLKQSRDNSPQSLESFSDDQLSPKHSIEDNNNVIEKELS